MTDFLWHVLPGQSDALDAERPSAFAEAVHPYPVVPAAPLTPRPGLCPNCRRAPSSKDGITMTPTLSWPIRERACEPCTEDLFRAGDWGFQ